jgi:hypothetical protein
MPLTPWYTRRLLQHRAGRSKYQVTYSDLVALTTLTAVDTLVHSCQDGHSSSAIGTIALSTAPESAVSRVEGKIGRSEFCSHSLSFPHIVEDRGHGFTNSRVEMIRFELFAMACR